MIRVFNLHLPLMNPRIRIEEFERAMKEKNDLPTVVCGDFNILEKPHITPIDWLLGGSILDTLLYTRERKNMDKHFSAHELTNALSKKITHPFSRSQLDHILVPCSFSIKNTGVISDRHGSDHCPVWIEIG